MDVTRRLTVTGWITRNLDHACSACPSVLVSSVSLHSSPSTEHHGTTSTDHDHPPSPALLPQWHTQTAAAALEPRRTVTIHFDSSCRRQYDTFMREPTKTILVIDFTVVTQSYMPPTRLSTNGMRHPTVLPSRIAAPHFDQYSFPVPLRVGG